MSAVLFGTDGVRGRANSNPITPEVALQLGKSLARVFGASGHGSKRALIGKDTRLSGYMLETALTSGMVSMGMDVYLVGPMPTPAVAHLTRSMTVDCGLMITASHNPACDNGIKIFGADGRKLDDDLEAEIEALVLGGEIPSAHIAYDKIGKAHRIEDARGRYIEFAKSTVGPLDLRGLRLVVDCANGANYFVAPLILRELGAEVIPIGVEPDGYNINAECGALHPEALWRTVWERRADLGLAFDGDGDRIVIVDQKAAPVAGDRLLGLCARELHRHGQLARNTVVVTVESNLGLIEALEANGIAVVVTPVGDRHVLEVLRDRGLSFGGESSGHVIFHDYSTTGDGLICALQVLKAMQETGRSVAELADFMTEYPIVRHNLQVRHKLPLDELPTLPGTIEECEQTLGDRGRHLVRYSGTENCLRILVEARNADLAREWCNRLVAAARADLDFRDSMA